MPNGSIGPARDLGSTWNRDAFERREGVCA
ncbi:hypothetical protein HNR73_007703 [Phytomonospora endophytica]|uniref:Uncharacterized protein n=1 Tax=Phytomonospora endophytica TaxID=714109 RepID=A0A841FVJ8_9ACTN|nr:hypothetical protein [Phytomonospora endophytica]